MRIPLVCLLIGIISVACSRPEKNDDLPWNLHGKLVVKENSRIIQYANDTPFLWLGCTAWGMTEWLSREEVDFYLNDRQSKGMNVVQLCLFWGKRVDYPIQFTANDTNPYGHKAFEEVDGLPDPSRPAIVEFGSPLEPNDYWDHVDYCLDGIKKRGMYAAVLPVWGKRYVNATFKNQSLQVFTLENISRYGEFLGKRYGKEPHIIWVSGGDVPADEGSDYQPHYHLLAEGLVKGASGKSVKWNEESEAWNSIFMTYHPSGSPMLNSSTWFHNDYWLDFNMIETHTRREYIVASIRKDLEFIPLKPTVMAEGHYEGETNRKMAEAIHVRRQAYQTFFAGAAGYTYGGGFDKEGNGPLFSPSNNWKHLLQWEGAGQLVHLRKFLEENDWWTWEPVSRGILRDSGVGELEKLIVKMNEKYLIYFPENASCFINLDKVEKAAWFNTKTGEKVNGEVTARKIFSPPKKWEDSVLILE